MALSGRMGSVFLASTSRRAPGACGLWARALSSHPDASLGPNDVVSKRVRNRNPVNLERMRIGYKPSGFALDKGTRSYWNGLSLRISGQHSTATVNHWTGREVCRASTRDWAIAKFLYNYTDSAALKTVGRVIGQRCLEAGLYEVCLLADPKDMAKERMTAFIRAIQETGLVLEEPDAYVQFNPHYGLMSPEYEPKIRPWEVVDE